MGCDCIFLVYTLVFKLMYYVLFSFLRCELGTSPTWQRRV